ncbi:MAG TPA: signal peptidase II [Acidimicrobiales bacterium]|nr:signal peptidase II [Acidimicrobiales bacterium]
MAAVVVGVDQVTKSLALAHLHRPVHLVGPLGLGLGFNSGSAFSLFVGRASLLTAAVAAAAAVLGVMAWRSASAPRALAFGLVLGGALGNLSDRLFRGRGGAVVDFITLTHWPTFNVADVCITVGVALLVLTAARRPASRRSPGP